MEVTHSIHQSLPTAINVLDIFFLALRLQNHWEHVKEFQAHPLMSQK